MCTPEDEVNRFYFDGAVPTVLRIALTNAISGDYDVIDGTNSGVEGIVVTSLTSTTEVRVRYVDLLPGTGAPWAFQTCAAGAVHGHGNGVGDDEYAFCGLQYIVFKPQATKLQECLADAGCLAWIGCHEVGHTYGISHAAASRETCTNYEEFPFLDDHDEQHLEDCFPKPTPVPDDLTSSCRDYV